MILFQLKQAFIEDRKGERQAPKWWCIKMQRKELINYKIDVGSLELYAFEDNANVYIIME